LPAPLPPANRVLALLDAALTGDRAAQESLMRKVLIPAVDAATSRTLFGRAGRFLEREQVVQEVVLHLWENDLAKLRFFDRTKGPLEAFLVGVTRSWVRDNLRRRDPPEALEDPEREQAPDSGPENRAYMGELWARLMNALDEEELLLFRWLYREGVARAEIAERLQISMDLAYKRLQEMEKKVKNLLSNPETPLRIPGGRTPKEKVS
jgi:RNA polymerase sigma factor (sigma-70 family)